MVTTSVESELTLYRWRSRPLLGIAVLLFAIGFAQFGPAAILADVADHFGEQGPGDSVAEQAGLSGTVLGIGLAVVRVASLGALLLAAVADRLGRRRTAWWWATLGLSVTIAAAAAPGYWVLVAALALARPLLTATNTVAQVLAAELTSSTDRAMALAVCTAAYGLGTGAVVVTRTVFDSVGFRGVLLMVVVPLALALAASRLVVESERFLNGQGERVAHPLRLDLGDGLGSRLAVLAAVTAAAAAVTGPSNTLLFVYAENVLDLSSAATAALTVAGGPIGLAGLLLGRAASDRFGRRVTAGVGLALLASSVLVAYSGTAVALVPGFLAGVLFGSMFATPALALANELFPTSVRASAAGWLVVSGVLGASAGLFLVGATADRFGGFAPAFAMVCVPAIAAAGLLARLPETRGLELEASSSSTRSGTSSA